MCCVLNKLTKIKFNLFSTQHSHINLNNIYIAFLFSVRNLRNDQNLDGNKEMTFIAPVPHVPSRELAET